MLKYVVRSICLPFFILFYGFVGACLTPIAFGAGLIGLLLSTARDDDNEIFTPKESLVFMFAGFMLLFFGVRRWMLEGKLIDDE